MKAEKKKGKQKSENQTILFDTTAPQDVFVKLRHKGREVEVTHRLNFPSDERLILYYNACKLEEKYSEGNYSQSDTFASEAEKLWNELVVSRAGYAENNHTDWKEKTNALHKEAAIRGLLFVSSIIPEILDAEFVGVLDDETELITLKALFNGQYVETKILMNQPNAEQMRQYRKIRDTNIERTEKEITSTTVAKIAERVELFEELFVSAEGYKSSMPATHKAAAIVSIMENQVEFVAKN